MSALERAATTRAAAGDTFGHADNTGAAWVRRRANGEEQWKLLVLRNRARQGLKFSRRIKVSKTEIKVALLST
eukprot:1783133-Pleurochrysis_carterae.AAC.1